MSAIVIEPFKCKVTKKRFKPGQTYEADSERIECLQKAGYLDDTPLPDPVVESEQVEEDVAHEPEGKSDLVSAADHNAYQLMTKKELFKELNRRKIKFNERQTKTELISLLQKERMGDE